MKGRARVGVRTSCEPGGITSRFSSVRKRNLLALWWGSWSRAHSISSCCSLVVTRVESTKVRLLNRVMAHIPAYIGRFTALPETESIKTHTKAMAETPSLNQRISDIFLKASKEYEGHLATRLAALSRNLRVVLQLITGEVAGTLRASTCRPTSGKLPRRAEDMAGARKSLARATGQGDQSTKDACFDGWHVGGEDT